MMRSLYSGVSGVKGHQTRMDVIGNNIANVNTTGFKSSRVTFADTLSQTQSSASAAGDNTGGINPKQIGLGVGVASIDMLFTDGSVQSTGKNTDLCLSGNGLFVLKSGNETYYTRDGAFEFDGAGNYVLPGSGLKVQGWMASDGTLNTSGDVTDIVIPSGKSMEPVASTQAVYTNNINASTVVVTKINGLDAKPKTWTCNDNNPCTLTLSDGTTVAGDSGKTYTVGDVYSTVSNTYNTPGDMAVISSQLSPVTVTLADGTSHNFAYTSTDQNWKYGFTSTTTGDSATASSNVSVTVKGTDRTVTGTNDTKYTIGEIATSTITSGIVTKNASDTSFVLLLEDATEHNVTSVGGTYEIGSDTYTYDGITSKVIGVKVSFPVTELDVISDEGDGAMLRIGNTIAEGYALNYITDGSTVTASDDQPVTITVPGAASDGNALTVTNLTTGTYAVGDSYEGERVTEGNVTAGSVRIYLDDGTYHDDTVSTGTTYTVGGDYTYTNSNSSPPNTTTAQITGYAKLSTISKVAVQKQISSVDYSYNILISSITPGSSTASPEQAITLTMSDGTTQTVTSGTYNIGHSLPITTIVNVTDSLGIVHAVPVYFTKTSTGSGETTSDGNQWTISVDGSNVAGTSATITEDDGSTTTISMDPVTLQFSTTGELLTGQGSLAFTLTDGANRSQTVALDVSNLTQYAGNSTFNGTADGYAAGTLKSISIDSAGVITGTYTNGEKRSEAQVAVAQFSNASGLTKTGNSLYQTSNNSGTPNVKTVNDLGCTITPSALEMSNVDIANEFSDMIITQRGFQSNSKIITVSDEMLETMINMKR